MPLRDEVLLHVRQLQHARDFAVPFHHDSSGGTGGRAVAVPRRHFVAEHVSIGLPRHVPLAFRGMALDVSPRARHHFGVRDCAIAVDVFVRFNGLAHTSGRSAAREADKRRDGESERETLAERQCLAQEDEAESGRDHEAQLRDRHEHARLTARQAREQHDEPEQQQHRGRGSERQAPGGGWNPRSRASANSAVSGKNTLA